MPNHLTAAGGELVHLHKGQPVTDSLAIAREFGRRHDNVLRTLDSLISDGTIGRLNFKETSYADEWNRKQRMIELTERGALIAMPFIGGKKSRAGQVRLVDAFMAMRDALTTAPADWQEARKKVSAGYSMMTEALQEIRAEDGKQTLPHHYANEAKLVNWVLFGRFEGVDRNDLTQADLSLMEKVEARNAIWVARGRTYEERKAALPAYLASLRIKRIGKAQGGIQ